MHSRPSRLLAEFLGTLILLTAIVGSGIAAQRLSPYDTGLQLLENAFATALGLFVVIIVFQPLSGAHFNPVISAVDAALGHRGWSDALSYVPAQFLGAVGGAVLANLMFGLPAVEMGTTQRLSPATFLSEVVATAGLVLIVFLLSRSGRAHLTAPVVAAYIGAAFFFTSSTAFANPAVSFGRIFTDTFAGTDPGSALGFVGAQLLGGLFALALIRALAPRPIIHQRRADGT